MTDSAAQNLDHTVGPSTPVAPDNVHTFCFSNPFQYLQHDFVSSAVGIKNEGHSFDGQPIPPQRASLIHAGTGATLSWQRVRHDSLRIARYLRALVGEELKWDGKGGNEPIHSPRTTVLLHLPNCLAFPVLFLGGAASLCTMTTISIMLTSEELANVLSKARPQVLVTTVGADGEGKLRKALEILIKRPEKDVGAASGTSVKAWANDLAASWDRGRMRKSQRGEQIPLKEQRVWTVNPTAEYYGSSARRDGVSTMMDPRDWSHMLSPPAGHKHAGSLDRLDREPFVVRKLTQEEQTRRVIVLLWSSGTTGDSKGVLLSHRNIVASIVGVWTCATHLQSTAHGDGETWVALAPWFHVYGLVSFLLPTFASGITVILPASPKFELATYLRLVTKYRATSMHIAPPVAVALRSTPLLDKGNPEAKGIDISSVRAMLSGGAPTPTEVIKAIHRRTGKMLQIGYGATETGSSAHTMAVDFRDDLPDSLEELGSVGCALANVEVAIRPSVGTTAEQTKARFEEVVQQGEMKRKAGESAPVQPGLPGEVCLRGPHNLLGYYSGQGSDEGAGARDPKLTGDALTGDGFYRTGDEGLLDHRGRLWIIGRTKELIKVRGFQVPPAELDSLFAKHPDLVDAAATGIMDGDAGEQVVMYVVPRDASILGSKEKEELITARLADFITDKAAYYKWPRYYVFASAIFKNPTGKILRKELHKIAGIRHLAPKPLRAKM